MMDVENEREKGSEVVEIVNRETKQNDEKEKQKGSWCR